MLITNMPALLRRVGRGCGAAKLVSALLLLSITTASAQPLAADDETPVPRGPCGLTGTRCCDQNDILPEEFGGGPRDPCEDLFAFCSSSNICVACGRGGEQCCPGPDYEYNDCNYDPAPAICNDFGICQPICGLAGLPCCTGAESGGEVSGCFGELFETVCAADDVCRACGKVGQRCCDGSVCGNRFLGEEAQCGVETNTCVPATCGLIGQRCCDPGERNGLLAPLEGEDGFCEYHAFCNGGECTACGYDGQPCCLNDPEYRYADSGCYREYGGVLQTRVYESICTSDNLCSGVEAPVPSPPPPPGPPPPPEECGDFGKRCCGPDDFGREAYEYSEDTLPSGLECRAPDPRMFFPGRTRNFTACLGGICVFCGNVGLPCCPGDDTEGCASDELSFCDEDGYCSAECGSRGDRCCPGGLCADGDQCDAATDTCVEITCGLFNQPCCTDAEAPDPCVGPLECSAGGVCSICGLDGGPCCAIPDAQTGASGCRGEGAQCLPDNTCAGAVPDDAFGLCGIPDAREFSMEGCCAGGVCARGSSCNRNNICLVCGQRGRQCCPGGRCDGRAACVDGICGAPLCGRLGQPCCDPGETYEFVPCISDGPTTCSNGTCELCGGAGQPCCTQDSESSACFSGSECVDDICTDGSTQAPLPPPAPSATVPTSNPTIALALSPGR